MSIESIALLMNVLLIATVVAALAMIALAVSVVRERETRRSMLWAAAGLLTMVLMSVVERRLPASSWGHRALAGAQGASIVVWWVYAIWKVIPATVRDARLARQGRQHRPVDHSDDT